MKHDEISLAGKKWIFRGKRTEDESLFQAICRIRGYSEEFLTSSTVSDLADPKSIPGILEAGTRILTAKENNEKIVIFGDFDLDGASGAATLYFALKTIGIFPRINLPSRTDGYGLSEKVYEQAHEKRESLLITVDCGSSNAEAIIYGNSLGIDTIVTDHHTLPKTLPPAVAVAHPHRGKETDDTWDLTGAGVAFFLGKYLLEECFPQKDISQILCQLAELAVLGTVADVGKLTRQNRILTNIGIETMRSSKHPGLKALLETAKIKPESVTAESIAFFLAPRLNAAGRMAHPNVAARLLLGDKKAAKELEELNTQRRDITADLCDLAEKEIQNSDDAFFAIFHENFFSGVAGLIAAKISEKYARPTVVFSCSDNPEILTASCRGPEDFHFTNALKKVSRLLRKYGGHAAAAGFSMPKKNLTEFKKEFLKIVEDQRGKLPPIAELVVDCTAKGEDFFADDFSEIFKAEPFGAGNPSAVFCLWNIRFHKIRPAGCGGIHLAGELLSDSKTIPFVAFRFAELLPEKNWEESFDALVVGEIQQWNGKERRQIRIVDLRISQKRK